MALTLTVSDIDPDAELKARFAADSEGCKLTAHRDDGLYRLLPLRDRRGR